MKLAITVEFMVVTLLSFNFVESEKCSSICGQVPQPQEPQEEPVDNKGETCKFLSILYLNEFFTEILQR